MARLNLLVLCAVALLAAVTHAEARALSARKSVKAQVFGGSYSSSGDDIFPPAMSSGLLSSIFEAERSTILQEARQSNSNSRSGGLFERRKRSSVHRFPSPAPTPRSGWPSMSKSSGLRTRIASRTTMRGSSKIKTKGNAKASVGGFASVSGSGITRSYSIFG